MFSFFKKKPTPPPVPPTKATPKPPGLPISGFPLHSPDDFQAYFDFLTLEQAEGVAEIYKALITPGTTHPLALAFLHEPHNAFAISNLLKEHLGIENTRKRGGVATYLSFIAGDVVNFDRRREIGITHEKWMYVVCDAPNHDKFDGKKYDITKGLFYKGTYHRPHGVMGCKCIGQAVVEGF